VQKADINLGELSFLIADPNPNSCAITHSILRGFGCNHVTDVRNAKGAIRVLLEQKVDMLICEPQRPPYGGLPFIRSLRKNPNNPCRTLPILVTTSDTRVSKINEARDSGANLVVVKPMSPSSLYVRIVWLVFNPRKFISVDTYCGPDRRSKIEGLPLGGGRRASDKVEAIQKEEGPALSQNEIDQLLQNARSANA
jgi:two-component system chemotaxis response regulator CheY